MNTIEGSFQDGLNSIALPATLQVDASELRVCFPGGARSIQSAELTISERLGTTARRLSWGTRAAFVTQDNEGVDTLARLIEKDGGWVNRLERSLVAVVGAALVTALVAAIVAAYGVPGFARMVATHAPLEISRQLGSSTLSTIDQVLNPSQLDPQTRADLADYLKAHGTVESIYFRHTGTLGPNALTLSASHVVLTDELVALADSREEVLAVYLHELGHARHKHVEQTILQNAAWIVLLSALLGDLSGASELILSLPLVAGQAAYSRDLERDADQFAIDALRTAGLSPDLLADILVKLDAADLDRTTPAAPDMEQNEPGSWSKTVIEYLSSHPATESRVQRIRTAATNR